MRLLAGHGVVVERVEGCVEHSAIGFQSFGLPYFFRRLLVVKHEIVRSHFRHLSRREIEN